MNASSESLTHSDQTTINQDYQSDRLHHSIPHFLMLIAIIMIAFTLRIYELEAQSIWNDEGLSIYRARQSIGLIMSNTITIDGIATRDTNPPLFFLILSGWRKASGETVFALRYLSAFMGVLNIPLLYLLGKNSINKYVGMGAAFLLAISPFHIWMSQEIRNYSLLLFFSLLSIYGLLRFAAGRDRRQRWLVLWCFAGVAAIYTHYFGVFVFAFSIFYLIWLSIRQHRWHISGRLVIILLIIGLASLPILWAGFQRFQVGQQIDFVFVPIHHLLSHAASAFSVGIVHAFVQPLWRVAPAIILAIVGSVYGCFYSRHSGKQDLFVLVLGYLFVPFMIFYALTFLNPIYNGPRHLLIYLPPFLLLVSAGSILPWRANIQLPIGQPKKSPKDNMRYLKLFRVITGILIIWLVLSQISWLRTQFTSTHLIKDDFRGLANYLNQVAREDDLIVLHDTISGIPFDFYYDGEAEWITIPALSQQSVTAASERMRLAGESADHIWFVTEPKARTGFPRSYLREWASANWTKISERRFPSLWLSVKLESFIPDPGNTQMLAQTESKDIDWDGELILHGYTLPESVTSGSFFQPVFYWSQQQANTDGYNLSIRFTDEQGHIWAQIDQPMWKWYPPSAWPNNEVIRYEPIYSLPSGIPPGNYQVNLRVTGEGDKQPLFAGDDVEILLSPEILVTPAKFNKLKNQLPDHVPLNTYMGGDIELLGFNIPASEFRPGHGLTTDLYWRVLNKVNADYSLIIQLVDSAGIVVGESVTSPTIASYPASRWQEEELLNGKATLLIPPTLGAGIYTVRIALQHPETEKLLPAGWPLGSRYIDLADVQIAPWPMEITLPSIPSPLKADFGEPPIVELHGYELAGDASSTNNFVEPGDVLDFSLFWRSLSDAIPASLSVFVHLTDELGQTISQADGLPVAGFRPTTSWRDGEVIVDERSLMVPIETELGMYDIWIGLYDPKTNQRLPIFIDDERQGDDRLQLTTIRVEP